MIRGSFEEVDYFCGAIGPLPHSMMYRLVQNGGVGNSRQIAGLMPFPESMKSRTTPCPSQGPTVRSSAGKDLWGNVCARQPTHKKTSLAFKAYPCHVLYGSDPNNRNWDVLVPLVWLLENTVWQKSLSLLVRHPLQWRSWVTINGPCGSTCRALCDYPTAIRRNSASGFHFTNPSIYAWMSPPVDRDTSR